MKYNIYDNSIDCSGNKTTLTRLSNILNVKLINKIQDNIIGIHAYKFGKFININININYIIILGGTDINEDIYDDNKRDIIQRTLNNSKYIISFNIYLKDKIIEKFNINENKIKIIPQSVGNLDIEEYNFKKKIRFI